MFENLIKRQTVETLIDHNGLISVKEIAHLVNLHLSTGDYRFKVRQQKIIDILKEFDIKTSKKQKDIYPILEKKDFELLKDYLSKW